MTEKGTKILGGSQTQSQDQWLLWKYPIDCIRSGYRETTGFSIEVIDPPKNCLQETFSFSSYAPL